MPLPTLHLIAPFFSTITPEWSHEGFTERTRLFSKMMQARGYRVIEYAAEASTSEATEKVSVLSMKDHLRFFPKMKANETRPPHSVQSQGWVAFNFNLSGELATRVEEDDIVCHVYGDAHKDLVKTHSWGRHVEIGVGYDSAPFGAWRIFDSHAWRHYHWGKEAHNRVPDNGRDRFYSWVIPNPQDEAIWAIGAGERNTVVYFGRLDGDKGMPTIVAMIREHALMVNEGIAKPLHFVFGGYGDFDQQIYRPVHASPNPLHKDNGVKIEYMGPIATDKRAELLGSARCLLAPTVYVEPLHNCALQAMLCGTPVLSSDYGGFAENVRNGIDGFRCQTLGDYLAGLDCVEELNRGAIAAGAKARFGMEYCGGLYDAAFRQLSELTGPGWQSRKSYRIPTTRSLGRQPSPSESSSPRGPGDNQPGVAPVVGFEAPER